MSCERCGREYCDPQSFMADEAECYRLGYERLKAENASLRDSLRDKTAAIDRMKVEWDATAKRGAREVAEKRNKELQVALRAAHAWFAEEAEDGRGDAWKMRDLCRAALHDEERSAPQASAKQTCVRCQGRGFRTAPPGGSMRCEDCEGFGWIRAGGAAQGEEK